MPCSSGVFCRFSPLLAITAHAARNPFFTDADGDLVAKVDADSLHRSAG